MVAPGKPEGLPSFGSHQTLVPEVPSEGMGMRKRVKKNSSQGKRRIQKEVCMVKMVTVGGSTGRIKAFCISQASDSCLRQRKEVIGFKRQNARTAETGDEKEEEEAGITKMLRGPYSHSHRAQRAVIKLHYQTG